MEQEPAQKSSRAKGTESLLLQISVKTATDPRKKNKGRIFIRPVLRTKSFLWTLRRGPRITTHTEHRVFTSYRCEEGSGVAVGCQSPELVTARSALSPHGGVKGHRLVRRGRTRSLNSDGRNPNEIREMSVGLQSGAKNCHLNPFG